MVKKPTKASLENRLNSTNRVQVVKDFRSDVQDITDYVQECTNNVQTSTEMNIDINVSKESLQNKINRLKIKNETINTNGLVKLEIGNVCIQEVIPNEKKKSMKRGAYHLRLEVLEKIELLSSLSGLTKAEVVDLLLNKALNDVIDQLD